MVRILEFAWSSTATNTQFICMKKPDATPQEGKKLFKLQRSIKLESLFPKLAEICSLMSWKQRGVSFGNGVSAWCKLEPIYKGKKKKEQALDDSARWFGLVPNAQHLNCQGKILRKESRKKPPQKEMTHNICIEKAILRILHPSCVTSDNY